MAISDVIYQLRNKHELSQETFASMMGVSRQAVQKWENGSSTPDIDKIISIAKKFQLSIDTLLLGSDLRANEEMVHISKLEPDYPSIHAWELYSSSLDTEYTQGIEEGLDISSYKALFEAVHQMPPSAQKEKMADVLFEIVQSAPMAAGFSYLEPSDLEGIRELCRPYSFEQNTVTKSQLRDKIKGAWIGRISGCLLGKPVEGMRTEELHPLLRETGNFPMHRYIKEAELTDEICDKIKFRLRGRTFPDNIECAPVDDDTNYTVLYQIIVDRYGRDFTPVNVASSWLKYQPKDAYCTAERVAFRNFVNGYVPPVSGSYKNPYREWIGAQIRGDYFGYINPGDPKMAAEMAWRDGCISHVKNGIYGEMFAAAMIACAAVTDDIEDIIRGGLAQIPATSRLYEVVMKQLEDYHNGVDRKQCFAKIHERFDEHSGHDWCHTISNALIVTASLLYGGGDYGKSICMAVETGFDTDCNGATVGSVLGMRNGSAAIGSEWTMPLNGQLDTSIFGVGRVKISELIEKTMEHLPDEK